MNGRFYLSGLWLASLAASTSFLATTGTLLGPSAMAQTFNGNTLAFRSTGSASGTDWTLNQDGYVGTYLRLDQPGDITLTAQATGIPSAGVNPHMSFVIADSSTGFDVSTGFNSYQQTFSLPAGTYFVRTQFDNDPTASSTDRQLTIRDLTFSGPAVDNLTAHIENTTTQATNNGYALQAADDYVKNYRQGSAQLNLANAIPGSTAHVKLKQHAFNFGTEVGGTSTSSVNSFLNNTNYKNFLLSYFNTVTQGNAGKWDSNEPTQGNVQMGGSDAIKNFAVANGLRDREHTLIWGSQQPGWVNTLITNAQNANPAISGPAKTSLSNAIVSRIAYYVGNGSPNDRTKSYMEMDVLNEELHQGSYWKIFGASGIADIFNQVAAAVTAAGANTRLALNEYNVLQFSSDRNGISDPYANWFRNDVEAVRNAGGAISAIGVQYYPTHASGTNDHSPSRMAQTFANLAVTGLPLSLTEFGVQKNNSSTGCGANCVPDPSLAATYLTDTMRLTFGNPSFTTFDMWGFWANDMWSQAPYAALLDANFNLIKNPVAGGPLYPGEAFVQLMNQWTTDVTLPVDADGNVDFTGFYGNYDVTVAGQTYHLNLTKGTTDYTIPVHSGDYNGNGVVDAADYTVWRDGVGSTTDLRADGNGNGVVDDGDYAVWQSFFGAIYSSGAGASDSAAVPEPSCLILLFSVVFALTVSRRCSC